MTKPSVFISYSHKDKKWVTDYLLTNLEKNGIPCHIDYRDFEIGTASLINMEQAVEKCKKTILVFTPDWVNSEFTNFEGLMLQTDDPAGLKKRIFPIMLHKCTPPKRLKIFTYANFTDKTQWGTQLERVIKQIQKDFEITEPAKKTYPPLNAHHIDITRLPQTGFELFGRHKELTLLNEAWESDAANIVSFVAYGGVGKSTLVNKWVEKMRWDNYRGAEKVYAWSFYSQGTSERVTSADMFINNALEWFGDADPTQGSLWDKGKRLAGLINNHKTLLILDGLEPLQTAEKVEKGKIKDPALTTLVTELAKNNNGLCLITTREHVPELDHYAKTTQQFNLEHISNEAGRKLLETRRISGAEKELEHTVQQFGNHALAINLLAEYLHIFKNHPLEEANNIPNLNIPEKRGKHARRIIEAFAKRFGSTSAEFQLLSILGLFDRPVPIDAIKTIIRDNPVPGLADKITDTSGSGWLTTLENLRKHKLLFKESEHRPDTLDCHPLIREHFGEKLEQQNPDGWKQAHVRLYEYYKRLPKNKYPDTLKEMEPLFVAVMHGCLAGKYKDTFSEVFFKRIYRKGKSYSLSSLGAISSNLEALSYFFKNPYNEIVNDLELIPKSFVFEKVSHILRAMGMVKESLDVMQKRLSLVKTTRNPKNLKYAANAAGSVSTCYILLGDIKKAIEYAIIALKYGDFSKDFLQQSSKRTTLARAFHFLGETNKAEQLYLKAEEMLKEQPKVAKILIRIQGYRYCDLLLDQKEYSKVYERAHKMLLNSQRRNDLLDTAHSKLLLGQVLMYQELDKGSMIFTEPLEYLTEAIGETREAGTLHELPDGLLARAKLYRLIHDFPKSWADLDEAREIAEYGQMKLHLTDYHLDTCRNIIKQLSVTGDRLSVFEIIEKGETLRLTKEEMQAKFGEHFKAAEQLVKATGYFRRNGELGELRIKNENRTRI